MKFLGKCWSYFMGVKDCLLVMITLTFLALFTVRCWINDGTMSEEEYMEVITGKKEEPKKNKKTKMGFHVVEND